jgi:carbon storage regulator
MLVLSRKIGEDVKIGNSVTVTVLSYDRGVVRLGIQAPKEVAVHRKEIYDKIVELNKIAAKSQLTKLKDALNSNHLIFNANEVNLAIPKNNGSKSNY